MIIKIFLCPFRWSETSKFIFTPTSSPIPFKESQDFPFLCAVTVTIFHSVMFAITTRQTNHSHHLVRLNNLLFFVQQINNDFRIVLIQTNRKKNLQIIVKDTIIISYHISFGFINHPFLFSLNSY